VSNTARTDGSMKYDVFLSYSHYDTKVVEELAERLDDITLSVWLDKWNCVPGEKWQQAITKGLDHTMSCAVCVGKQTPQGWFREEIEHALNRQTKDDSFHVIPVLLPDADVSNVDKFLELRTWVDFTGGIKDEREFHNLVSGITRKPPGRWNQKDPKCDNVQLFRDAETKLTQIKRYHDTGIIFKEVAMEYQRKVLDKLI